MPGWVSWRIRIESGQFPTEAIARRPTGAKFAMGYVWESCQAVPIANCAWVAQLFSTKVTFIVTRNSAISPSRITIF